MISVQVDSVQVEARFEAMPARVRAALRGTIADLTRALRDTVKAKLSGPVLNIRSGQLINSIMSEMVENKDAIYGRVFVDPSSPAAKYAGIHEYGGIINHPGSDKLQVFQIGGRTIFTQHTNPHQIPMPQRSYLRSSLADMQDQIIERLTSTVQTTARAA